MFNLAAYTEALTTAEQRAVAFKTAYIVRYWTEIDEFMAISLENATTVGGWEHSTIAASVDHTGVITQSKWVAEQIEKVAA